MRIRPLATLRHLAPVLLVILLVLVAACSPNAAMDEVGDAPGMTDSLEHAVDEPESEEAPVAADDADDGEAVGVAGEGDATLSPLPASRRDATPERIIKEGTVTIEVDEGQFSAAYERVVEAARRLGGSVTASTSTSDDDGRTSGSITVRVPVESYEDLLVGVGRIGDVRERDIRSQDVTGEVVDLQARLRHLRAQERFYLELLEDADSVQDAIAVQQQVDGIQQRLEQLQGRLDVLEDRAAYSTLTVELVEAGAEPVVALGSDEEPTLAAYLQAARNGFIIVVGWLLVTGASLAPVLVPAAVALAAWRLLRRRTVGAGTVAVEAD